MTSAQHEKQHFWVIVMAPYTRTHDSCHDCLTPVKRNQPLPTPRKETFHGIQPSSMERALLMPCLFVSLRQMLLARLIGRATTCNAGSRMRCAPCTRNTPHKPVAQHGDRPVRTSPLVPLAAGTGFLASMAVAQKSGTKMEPGKWKHGPKPAVCPSCLILSLTHIGPIHTPATDA